LDKYLSSTGSSLRDKGQGFLKGGRLLPFLAALVLLAFALGSLPRSQPGGPSLLLNSTWLIYFVYIIPLIALGLIVALIFFLAYNWRFLSDAIGFGMRGKRKQQKKKSKTIQFIISLVVWLIAIQVLFQTCGGLFCTSSQAAGSSHVQQLVSGSAPLPGLPSIEAISQLDNIVQANWFYTAFLGLIAVSSVIIIRAIKVSWEEMKEPIPEIPTPQAEGMTAVEDAIQILESQATSDPRTRIINCYQRMIQAAQHLGAPITSDQTARELETAMRKMLMLRGSAITALTDLFEEARYSLHPITEQDGQEAHEHLLAIAEEMKLPVSV